MQITRLELNNFRNHQHLVLEDIGKTLIIVGNNAVGKTNIIEALQLLNMHTSFRKPKNNELINKKTCQNKEACISASIQINSLENIKKIILTEEKKRFFYNKKERTAKELLHTMPTVLFTPDDLQIIKGSPEQRRDLLDNLGARLSKTFLQIKNDYYKILKHKNSLLRQEERQSAVLDSWNIQLAKVGACLIKHRRNLFSKTIENASKFYKKISKGEELQGSYITFFDPYVKKIEEKNLEKELYTIISNNKEKELFAHRTLIGPHKDDIAFSVNGNDARRFASQGQQRSIALSLKMAEIIILKRIITTKPLLLLDDVMSELDETRRDQFMTLIKEAGQTVLTTTNLGYFKKEFLHKATVVELGKEGKETKL